MPRGFEKTMQRRYWLTEVEAGGALAAFEHQHPDIAGKFAVVPALIRYTL
jgi:hypothetical protein